MCGTLCHQGDRIILSLRLLAQSGRAEPATGCPLWGNADIDLTPRNVRYWSNSGHRLNAQDVPRCANCTPSSENRHLTNERAFFCWPFYFSTRRPALVDRPWTIHRRSRTAANADRSVCQKSACQRLLRTRRPPATTPQRLPLRLSSDPFASNFGCHAAWWRAPVSPPAPNRISTVRLVAYRFDSFGSLALFEPVTRRVTFGLRIMGFGRGGSYSFGTWRLE